jgi:hypothetical protein
MHHIMGMVETVEMGGMVEMVEMDFKDPKG